jgi:hypothetical protein
LPLQNISIKCIIYGKYCLYQTPQYNVIKKAKNCNYEQAVEEIIIEINNYISWFNLLLNLVVFIAYNHSPI